MIRHMKHPGPFPTRKNRRTFALSLFLGGTVLLGLATSAGAADPGGSFKLHEISISDLDKNSDSFLRGQICRCQDKPFSEVKHYPDFVSKAPIFGSVKFGGRADDTNTEAVFYFAVDESKGTGKGYDRFYFDRNRDLDLRNDAVIKPQAESADHGYSPNFSSIKSKTVFDFLKLNLAGPAGGTNSVEIMPRLMLTGDDKETYRFVFFVRTHAFEGDFKLAGQKFHALLGNDYTITPDFDSPGTALKLEGNGSFDWWGGDRIAAIHQLGGHFYTFSATSDGVLTAQLYTGDLGRLELGAGGRTLPTNVFSLTGSLNSGKQSVAAGGKLINGRPVETASCELPAGDYLPEFLTLQYGRMRIQLSQNYHSEGKRQSREGRPPVYGLAIRKDQPFVLNFTNPPEVMFTSFTNSQRVKLGDELLVAAVLVDPKLDIMFRRLEDTLHKQTNDATGKPLGYARNFSLDPTVIITRANGDKVAEGVMPFG